MSVSWQEEARRFHDDLVEVADGNWLHPAWLSVIWGSALLRGRKTTVDNTRAMHTFRSANGGPESDTFMARPSQDRRTLADRIARAVVAGESAIEQLEILESRLPGQRLQTCLQWENGWLNPKPLHPGEKGRVVFITPRGNFLAAVGPNRRDANASALLYLMTRARLLPPAPLLPIDEQSSQAVRASVAVSLFRQVTPEACHLHRTSWSPGGGPWLGIGESDGFQIVSTCHRGIEGFGHALLADGIFARLDQRSPALAKTLKSRIGNIEEDLGHLAPIFPAPAQLGWSTRFVSGQIGRFVHQAYAMGAALQKFYSGTGSSLPQSAGFAPTFHVPVAPLSPKGDVQRDSLVRHGLLSVRMRDGCFEPLESFEGRLRLWLARERIGDGLLTRLVVANAGSRFPGWLKRRVLRSRRRPSRWVPPVEILSGRGRLSVMRFPDSECPAPPLYAVAAPALFPTERDPRGGQALTLIHHAEGCSVTLAGTGLSQTSAGAEAFLDLWFQELETVLGAGEPHCG